MVGPNPTTLGRARESVREFFLLERAAEVSEKLGVSQRETVRSYHAAAKRLVSVAEDLRGPVQTPSALVLYQQGSFLYAVAYLMTHDERVEPASLSPVEAFRRLDAAIAADRRMPPPQFERARSMLTGTDPLELDRVSLEQAGRRIEDLAVAARWLGRLEDPRSPLEIKAARIVRVLIGGAAGLALLVSLALLLLAPKNHALYRSAAASSTAFSTTASGVVDGGRKGPYGFHSQLEDSPWLSIDLGRAVEITRLKVFGRTDGHYEQSIPLALEISDDGTSYREIASRTEPFSDHEPWVFQPSPPIPARHVRLRTTKRSYLVLSEVEVYGKAR